MEGETVRFATYKSYYIDQKSYNVRHASIISSVITSIILACFMINKENTLNISEIIIGVLVIVLIWIDTALLATAFNDIINESKKYKAIKDSISNVLALIDRDFPMYKSTDKNPYPSEVEELYELILKRWVNKNNEATREDARNSLIHLAEKKSFDVIYEYLKFDSTMKDHALLKTAYDNYCTKHKTDENFKCMTDLQENMNYIGLYTPTAQYTKYIDRLKAYIIYGIVLLIIFLFPIFHMLYMILEPGIIGIMSIIIVMIMSFIGYYMYTYN
jgi:hypothetical protein